MLTRIGFPFRVENGRLAVAAETVAAGEALRMLVLTHTGEMPLSRDYGADLEYNVPLEVAYGHEQTLAEKLATYHPHLNLNRMDPVLSADGVILDWDIEIGVAEN